MPPLVQFDPTGSLLGDEVRVASFLSLAFPRMSKLWNRRTTAQWREGIDREFKAMHSVFVRVRSQERAYARRHGRRLREPDLGIELGDAAGPPGDGPTQG